MKTYLPHQQRVLDEHRDLAEKLQRLDLFLDTKTFNELEITDQQLLELQLYVMSDYLNILKKRIDRF